MNYTDIKLGELLSHASQNIKRHALGILKDLQYKDDHKPEEISYCSNCGVDINWGFDTCSKCK